MSDPGADRVLQNLAQRWDREALIAAWNDLLEGQGVSGFGSGKTLEYLIIRAFEIEKSARVRYPYLVTYPEKFGTMEQVDGVVYLDGRCFIIECKDTSKPQDVESLAKLRFRLESRPPGTMGVLVSRSEFTTPAEVFAQFAVPMNVLLWGGEDVGAAVRQGAMTNALRLKYEYAIEEGLPNYPIERRAA